MENITTQNFDELVQSEKFAGFPQFKRDLINLLNIILIF